MEFFNLDLKELIINIGLLGAFIILFAECGLLIGFFLPGDSLIFTAGLLASQGYFGIWQFIIGAILAAVFGNQLGYYLGKKFGPKIFNKEESVLFHRDHVEKAKKFYSDHGAPTLILARFAPIIRTFVPVLAGVGQMPKNQFLLYNVIGGILWILVLSWLGFFIGETVPDIDKYILPILVIIIILSITPALIAYLKKK